VITGGAGGIGRASAVLFAKHGASVVVADMDAKGGRDTVEMVNGSCGRKAAVFEQVDVSKSEDCKRMVARAEKEFGKLTCLFNNAGIMMSADDDAVSTEEKVWENTFAINVKGVYLGCKHAIPAIKRAGGGTIINTASFVAMVGAVRAQPVLRALTAPRRRRRRRLQATPQLAYTASKGAVLAMTRELATIHARQNIRVNAICPGPLNTKLLQSFLDSEEKKARRLVHVPLGRFGEAEEIAHGALYLASTDSSFMTGASLVLDGGITSAYVTPTEVVDPFGGPPHLR
jgi:NAD(P)-dependent dehydrogenase (short-subunit alcohol dehydrogenase family)